MSDQTSAEELRELIREAHGVLKDMRAERREIEQLLDGIPGKVDDRIKDGMTSGLANLGEATKQAMDASVAKVFAEFDRLEAAFTGRSRARQRAGKPPLEAQIRDHVARRDGAPTQTPEDTP